jgi:hypothetical protein
MRPLKIHGRFCKAFGDGTNSTGLTKDCDCVTVDDFLALIEPTHIIPKGWRRILRGAEGGRD